VDANAAAVSKDPGGRDEPDGRQRHVDRQRAAVAQPIREESGEQHGQQAAKGEKCLIRSHGVAAVRRRRVVEHDGDAADREKREGHAPEHAAREERPEALGDEVPGGGHKRQRRAEEIRPSPREPVQEQAAERVRGQAHDAIRGEHEAEAGGGDARGLRMRRQEHVQHLVAQERQRIGDGEAHRELEAHAPHRPMLHRRLAHRKIRVPLHEPGRRVLCRRGDTMRSHRTGIARLAALLLAFSLPGLAAAAPEGTMTWGLHVTLASRWLDPAETEALVMPFMVLYAIHDAVVKPMTGTMTGPSLAESWTVSKDGLVYEFVLRKNARFHNGDPVTADDVKFSFERYRGAAAKLLKDRVREIQTPDVGHVRFVLREPWPDFMAFYGTTASGAAWVVPRKYVEKVGDEVFKKA